MFNTPNRSPFVKDGIHNAVVHRQLEAVNPERRGSKAAAHFQALLHPGERYTIQLRFSNREIAEPFADFSSILERRIQEADAYYTAIHDRNPKRSADEINIQPTALAGLMWGNSSTTTVWSYGWMVIR